MSRSAKAKALRSQQRQVSFDPTGWTPISDALYCKQVDGSYLYYDVERMKLTWRDIVKWGVGPLDIEHFIANRVRHA